MLLSVGFLLCAVAVVTCALCNNRSDQRSCEAWKRNNNYCTQRGSEYYCKKTCNKCGPTPIPATPPPPSTCGYSSVSQSRVINGKNAVPGAWPWMVSLQKRGSHYCGATLITPKLVLTASHCVSKIYAGNLNDWTVKLGAHNHYKSEVSVQRIKIRKVTMHPKYSRISLLADIAMLELAYPAKLTSRVHKVCLPKKDVCPLKGKNCVIAGWGSIAHPGRSHGTLQQAILPVVESWRCKHQSEVVCVGLGFGKQSNGKQHPNACRGDSGGPLVCQQSNGHWQLEGVASFVYTYCKYYTGYSPVNKYLDWINSFISAS